MSATIEPIRAGGRRTGEWLYGRWPDLLIGCGLAYLLSIPLLFALSEATGMSQWPIAAVMLLALLVNGPHYGATIVRVYDAREDRRKYFVFAVYLTIAIWALFAVSTHSLWLSSALITVYATWTPWHFAGQNYGLSLMFLQRRGVAVDAVTKRLVYASFVLSAVIAILAIHAGYEDFVFSPNTLAAADVPKLFAVKLPSALAGPLKAAVGIAYLGCLGAAAARLLRRARLRDLGPASLLVLDQALWFSVPAIFLHGSASRTEALVFSAVWVNAAHSLQYLWVTAYYAKASPAKDPARLFLWKALLAGTAVATLPGLVMAPNLLGGFPWDAGLAATFFAVVNLHHFILDGAIWKLRDGRVARVLLRGVATPDPGAVTPVATVRRWPRRLVWAVAALSLFVPLTEIYGRIALGSATRPEQVRRLTRALRWVGRETTQMHQRMAASYAHAGQHGEAIAHFQRSIELFPTGRAYLGLGNEYRVLGQWGRALEAFEAAIASTPELAPAHLGRAQALLTLSSGDRAQAVTSLERALELWPG